MPIHTPDTSRDNAFLKILITTNERQIPHVLESYSELLHGLSPRAAARALRRLTSAFVCPGSRFFHDALLVEPMERLAATLAAAQHDDGTYDQGNLHSPPDSAFSLQDLCQVWSLLHQDARATIEPILATLGQIIRNAGPALATGGLHTPNHRWEVCAALARINQLWPDRAYVERIEDWLGEGIDIDPDGLYSERSAIYASAVTNPCLLTVAWLLGKDQLVDVVRRNLEATLYLFEDNGEVETVHSRRQDQLQIRESWWYLLQYRELALRDRNGQFAGVAKKIEQRGTGELGDFLAELLERPELGAVLPAEIPLPQHSTHIYRQSMLVRIRRDQQTATIFGGTDVHAIPMIASGLSTNPTFFKLRAGAAILDSVRLSPLFFSTGHFRSNGLTTDGETYRLQDVVSAAYHLPLPPGHRRSDGAYALTNDGRFFSQMDFPHRPKQFRTLRTAIGIRAVEGGYDLEFVFGESAVPFTIELCFRRGGALTGAQPLPGADNYQLVEGIGVYSVGEDQIEFGPGNGSGPAQPAHMDPGERYTHLGGGLVPDGVRVYITGKSPCVYVFRIRTKNPEPRTAELRNRRAAELQNCGTDFEQKNKAWIGDNH